MTLLGLPTGATASFRVGKPGGDSVAVTGSATQTVSDLAPGSYFVHADAVFSGGVQFTPSPASQTVTVVEDQTTNVTIQYTPVQLPATALRVLTEPSAAVGNGVVFPQQPAIELRDAANGTVAQAGAVVTAAIATGGGTLGGTTTATTNAAGIATFTNLSISGTTGARTLVFSAPGLTNATSGAVLLTAGSASQVTITTQPSASTVSGDVLAQQPILQLRDASGNAVAQAGVNVTAAIATGGGALGGTLTVATTATGTATFTNLSITGAAGDRTLVFSAPALAGATSGTVTVAAVVATKLGMVTQPSATAGSGIPFAQQPAVQLQNAGGNPIAQAGVLVTAAIATGGGTMGGTTTATTNAAGLATFTNLSIVGAVGNRTLVFSAPGLTSVTSGTVALGAGAPAQLIILTQPSAAAQSGAVFVQQPSIQLVDGVGNLVSQAGVNVTAAIGTGAPALSGTLTVPTNASGVATFTNLAITGGAGNRTLSFAAAGLTGATSAAITIAAPVVATKLGIATQPSASAASGAVFAQQPVIQLRDAGDNPIAQAGVVVTASIASGGGTLGGTATATTNAAGQATFTNLSITGVIGNRTLLFSATGLTGVTSGSVSITAGAATQLSITQQPPSVGRPSQTISPAPVVQLRDASGNAVSQAGVNVTAAVASGAGTVFGTPSVATSAVGTATFTNLSINGSAGVRTLAFSASGLTGATSTAIDLKWVMTIDASNAGGASGTLSFTYAGGPTFICTITSVGAKTGCGIGTSIPSTVANITLTATRDFNWMNLTWGGACAGIGTNLVAFSGGNVAQCTLAMSSDRSVSVTFSP